MTVWVRKCASFDEDRAADRQFWKTLSADSASRQGKGHNQQNP